MHALPSLVGLVGRLYVFTYKVSRNQQLTLEKQVRERSKQGNWQLISAGRTDRQTGKLSRKKGCLLYTSPSPRD